MSNFGGYAKEGSSRSELKQRRTFISYFCSRKHCCFEEVNNFQLWYKNKKKRNVRESENTKRRTANFTFTSRFGDRRICWALVPEERHNYLNSHGFFSSPRIYLYAGQNKKFDSVIPKHLVQPCVKMTAHKIRPSVEVLCKCFCLPFDDETNFLLQLCSTAMRRDTIRRTSRWPGSLMTKQ